MMTQRTRQADPVGNPPPAPFMLGPWRVEPDSGRLSSDDTEMTLEPQLLSLLVILAREPGLVMSRDRLEAALWPDTVVGEDTLARTVSRLRRALGDSAQAPRYVETLPKRGYRLIETVTPVDTTVPAGRINQIWPLVAVVAGVALLAAFWSAQERGPDEAVDPLDRQVSRANDLYMQFTRADNEAAIALYEQVLAASPDNANAQAGLANALVQRVVRWPGTIGSDAVGSNSLGDALQAGLTRGPEAQAVLERAAAMAERAVQTAPRDTDALKALAFTHTARGNLDLGAELYEELLELDNNAWAAWINLGEIKSMRGDTAAAVAHYENGWNAMTRAYDDEPQRVGPWLAGMGVLIGETYERLEQSAEAELWYRRVLDQVPYEPEATARLAGLLAASGNVIGARSLCETLATRIGDTPGCAEILLP